MASSGENENPSWVDEPALLAAMWEGECDRDERILRLAPHASWMGAAVGGAIGFALLGGEWPPVLSPDGSGGAIAAALLVAQATLLGGVAPRMALWARQLVLCQQARSHLRRETFTFRGRQRSIATLTWELFSVAAAIIMAILIAAVGLASIASLVWTSEMPPWWRRVLYVQSFGLLCTAPGVLALRYVYLISHVREWRDSDATWPRDLVIGYLRFVRARTSATLNVLGLVVTSVVVSMGAVLAHAEESAAADGGAQVPSEELTLLVGLTLALGLAVTYLPPMSLLDVLDRFLVTRWIQVSDRLDEEASEAIDRQLGARQRLLADLRAESAVPRSLLTGTVIVGPLLAAVLQTFVIG